MREILQRRLQPPSGQRYLVRDCRIANMRRRDGSHGTIKYELSLEEPATGRLWDQTVTGITFGGERTRRVWESIRLSSVQHTAAAGQPELPPFAYLPEQDLLLQVFPYDHRLPALAVLMTGPPPELAPLILAELGQGEWRLHTWTAAAIQYRVDMRAIVRLDIRATDAASDREAERQFYAKIYRDPDQGRRAFRAQRDLHERATATGKHLIVARLIAYVDTLRTLLTEAVTGTSLSRIIRRDENSLHAVKLAARAVAEFHRLDVDAPPRPITDDIERLRDAQEFLGSVRPDLLDLVSETVEVVVSGLVNAPSALIHGDLKPDHILIAGDRAALLDFDLIGAADPTIDVAHLMAFLGKPRDRSRQRGGPTSDAAQVFVEEYFTHVPDTWRARLPLYHAMTGIHKAVGMCRRRGPDRQDRVEDVLREAQALLTGANIGAIPTYKRRLTRPAAR